MLSTDWLTQDELLVELDQAGITLAERTLRFWVTKGVIAAPARKPFSGADGRVGYYHRDTLALIPRILKLQEEGWKLRQIKQQLSQQGSPERPQRNAHAASDQGAQEFAHRYLSDLMTDTEARDRRRCFSSPAAASSELRQIRHYLVARLERLVGRGVAVRTTSAFLLGLDAKSMKRLVTRLKVSSSVRRASSNPIPEIADALQQQFSELDARSAAQIVAQQTGHLERWLASPRPPLLLRRALAALGTIEHSLSQEDGPGRTEQLTLALASLALIEQQATADLAFLETSTPVEKQTPKSVGKIVKNDFSES